MRVCDQDFHRIRIGEHDRVPFSSSVWFLGILQGSDRLEYYEFRCTKEGLKNLVEFCKKEKKNPNCILFGVWHGQYRTDVFLMEPVNLIARIQERTNAKSKKKTSGLSGN